MRVIAQDRCPNCDASGTETHTALRDKVYGAPGLWNMRRCENRACGVYWLHPAPDPADLAIAYRDYHTHTAETQTFSAENRSATSVYGTFIARRLGMHTTAAWLPRVLSRFLPLFANHAHSALYAHFYLPLQRDGALLEIGCGSGEHLQTLASDGWRVRGLDFDPAAVAIAQSRGLDVSVGDVRDLDLPADSFDAVVMAQLIEHVYDPAGLLAECARLLRPGGRLISITPNADALGHRVFGRNWRGLEPPRHLVVYTARGLRLACERAGLLVERIDATTRDATNLFLASDRIRKAPDGALIDRPTVGRRPPLRLHLLAAVEQLGKLCGMGWGEELVLSARK